jgi:Predicted membrane protein
MPAPILNFLLQWGTTSFSLWVCSYLFRGLRFESLSALLVSALVLGLVNTFVKPALVLLTLPLSIITLGFFLLVINALMILLVSALVNGFVVTGFWQAFFASIVISLLSLLLGSLFSDGPPPPWQPPSGGNWT